MPEINCVTHQRQTGVAHIDKRGGQVSLHPFGCAGHIAETGADVAAQYACLGQDVDRLPVRRIRPVARIWPAGFGWQFDADQSVGGGAKRVALGHARCAAQGQIADEPCPGDTQKRHDPAARQDGFEVGGQPAIVVVVVVFVAVHA